jgi:probable rRNA maturation factor
MIINILNQQRSLKISVKQVKAVVRHVLQVEKILCDEISLHFVDTDTICALHEQFFNDPSPTDCISFPMDQEVDPTFPYRILGEVFVCPATALQYAKEHQKNVNEELTLYVVHGLLHLIGYDDIEEGAEKNMRATEHRHMTELQSSKLILTA